jgi:hypothetical protein
VIVQDKALHINKSSSNQFSRVLDLSLSVLASTEALQSSQKARPGTTKVLRWQVMYNKKMTSAILPSSNAGHVAADVVPSLHTGAMEFAIQDPGVI